MNSKTTVSSDHLIYTSAISERTSTTYHTLRAVRWNRENEKSKMLFFVDVVVWWCDHLHLADDLTHSYLAFLLILIAMLHFISKKLFNSCKLKIVWYYIWLWLRAWQGFEICKKTVKSKVWLLPTFSRWKCILITSQKTKCTIWNNSYQLILVGRDCSKDSLWKYIRPILFTFNVGDWSIRPIRAHD